jgi:hypothetical protein
LSKKVIAGARVCDESEVPIFQHTPFTYKNIKKQTDGALKPKKSKQRCTTTIPSSENVTTAKSHEKTKPKKMKNPQVEAVKNDIQNLFSPDAVVKVFSLIVHGFYTKCMHTCLRDIISTPVIN